MEDNVRLFKSVTKPTAPIDEALVEGLEELLAHAKAGDIQGMAYVCIRSHGTGQYESCMTGWRGAGVETNAHTIIGGVAVLQARLLAEKNMLG